MINHVYCKPVGTVAIGHALELTYQSDHARRGASLGAWQHGGCGTGQ